jgi:AAA+ superfamily predicted ATPase
MARRLAYELCRIFKAPGLEDHEHDNGQPAGHDHGFGHFHDTDFGEDIVLVIIDGADIARGRYGDSEEQLRKLFDFAREGEFHGHRHDDDPTRRTVLLFDDVESLFLERGSGGAKEWHFSQNSVFFHAIDELDSAHTVVLLTTNRIDLVDAAIIDRFLPYEFSRPPTNVLLEVAHHRAALQQLDEQRLAPIIEAITQDDTTVKSLRDVERMVMRAYVASIVGDPATRSGIL